MKAGARHTVAALTFVGSLLAYVIATAIALILDLPVIAGAVGMAATLLALAAGLSLLADRHVWTIARNTLAQALRVKVAFVLLATFLVFVPALPFLIKGDGTLRGLLHVVIAYSLIAAGVLLGILTLTLATTTLWTEIRDKQVFLLEAKPLRRWQLLLGKFLGILLLNAALLAFMGIVTWASVRYRVAQAERAARDIPASNEVEKRRAEKRLRDAREQVLTARRALLPDPPPESDFEDFVRGSLEGRMRQLQRSDRMPAAAKAEPDEAARREIIRREALRQLAEEFHKLVNAVPPLYGRRWQFSGLTLPRSRDIALTIRFKFFSSDRKSEDADHVRWEFGVPNRTKAYRYDDAFMPDEVHEIQVPADAVDRDGVLEVRFYNVEPRRPTLVFSEADSIQALVPVGSFAGNLARGLAIIFVEVLFIAVLGLFCSTFLSFPVSPIVALAILLLTFLSGSLNAEFDKGFTFDQNQTSPAAQLAERATRLLTRVLHTVLPPFHRYSPSALVSSGEEVSPGLVLDATWSIALLYGGVLMLLGTFIFERREIALASP